MSKEVFISHSSKNFKEAKKICERLEKKNIECFIAPRDLVPGRVYGEEIVRGIDECDKFILLASKDAFESQHVLREVERAVNSNMKIYVYKIEDVEVPKSFEYFIMLSQWIDASFTSKIDELADIIREEDRHAAEVNKSKEGNVLSKDITKSDISSDKINDEQKDVVYANKAGKIKIFAATSIGIIIVVVACLFIKMNNDKTERNSKQQTVGDNSKSNENNINADSDNKKTDSTTESSDKSEKSEYSVGDVITIGSYNGEPIEWIVLNIDANGNKYILAKEIISIKAYDSAESGEWNKINDTMTFDREKEKEYSQDELSNAKGSNAWSKSNIRTWLNSKDKKVSYEGNAPTAKALYDSRIAYDKEEGFLNSFTDEELDKIVKKDDDYVFLPSIEEVNEYIIDGEVIFPETSVTKEALEADKTGEISPLVNEYGGKFPWFTRTESDECAYKVMCVFSDDYSIDGTPFYEEAVGSPRGIRPAMIIK